MQLHTGEVIPLEMHERIVESIETRHRADVGKLAIKLALYQEALEREGIEAPDPDGAELLKFWRDCASVVSTASDFVSELGTAKELITRRLGAPL